METSDQHMDNAQFLKRVTSATVHVGLLLLLLAWCLMIVMPLVLPVVWATVLAVSLRPLHTKLQRALGGRNKLAATLITLAALAVLLIPTALFFGSLTQGAVRLATGLRDGSLAIPPPPESIADWPVVGKQLTETWAQFTENAASAVEQYAPKLEAIAGSLMSAVAGLASGVLGFALATIIAGVFLAIGTKGSGVVEAVAVRLLGVERGRNLIVTTAGTIRSVAQGVLGVAVIQAFLIGVGLLLAGVPGAGLWTLLVLIFAIVQLPPLIVTGPIIYYVFTKETTGVAVVFAIWTVVASGADTFLKPLFLGRGLDVPMLVILVGAIGGMMAFGILGLFVGASVLAVAHNLFMTWLKENDADEPESVPAEPAPSP